MSAITLPATGRRRHTRAGWGSTAAGIAILAVLLFPIYWMINVSLQPSGSAVGTPWLPFNLSFDGYTTALSQQGRNLVTSLIVALGSVVFSLLIAMPAAYALAQFRVRFAGAFLFGILISQMIPGIVIANALITAGLFTFLFSWADFLFALTLTTTEDVRPVTLGLYTYIGTYVNDWSSVMATAVLASIPAIVLLVLAQRYVAAGTTAGAGK